MAADEEIEITAKKVSYQYKSTDSLILRNINLTFNKNKFIVLCGPTGSGKTTFIRSLNGLVPHFYHGTFYGYIRIKDVDTVESSITDLSKSVGMVFQNPENQLFAMNVERELVFGLENYGYSREIIKERIEEAVQLTGIQSLLNRPPYDLSGGEQQKVAIASLLALAPDILVLDEPLSNLDPHSAFETIQLLKRLQLDHQKTIILVEHHLDFLFPFADEFIFFENGSILLQGTPSEILEHPEIYEKRIDLPLILRWFKEKRDIGLFQKPIPFILEDQQEIIDEIFSAFTRCDKSENETSQEIKLQDLISDKSSMKNRPAILFNDVSYTYQTKYSSNVALSQISVALFPKEIVGIMGPNGAGKSTFIKCINNLRIPQQGQVFLFGDSNQSKPIYELAKKVGIVFQNPDHQLFANTIEEELKFSLKNLGMSLHEQKNRIESILKLLEIENFKDKSPFLLSGGQRKKVALATVLCRNPEILIFDEPTIGQDNYEKDQLKALIRREQEKGTLILIVSHDIEFLSDVTTRLLLFNKGNLIADGIPQEILTDEVILRTCSLMVPEIFILVQKLREKYPWIPEKIINVHQLEEVFRKCH